MVTRAAARAASKRVIAGLDLAVGGDAGVIAPGRAYAKRYLIAALFPLTRTQVTVPPEVKAPIGTPMTP